MAKEIIDCTLWIYPFTLVEDSDCCITVTDEDGTVHDIELMQDDDGNNAGYYNWEYYEGDKLVIKDDKGMVQPYTLTLVSGTYTYTVILEPAPGYKKLYAWKMSTKGKLSSNVPEYIYTTEYPVTEGCAIYDASGNLISNNATSLTYSGTDGETMIYANCDDWKFDVVTGGGSEL